MRHSPGQNSAYTGICVILALGLTVFVAYPVKAVEFSDYDFDQWSQVVTECDLQAAHGRDPGRNAPPVTRESMDTEQAIIACRKAVQNDPDNPRLNYQLGRAYGYSGRGEEAMPYRLKAVDADYPQSLFVIGYLYRTGTTIEQDVCKTLELWRRSARYKRLAALVALPRHYLRGDFSQCNAPLTDIELRLYLQTAARLTDDYYVQMLVEELLEKLE